MCARVCVRVSPKQELDCHQIQSAYLVHHGKETDRADFDQFSIGAPLGFVVPSLFEGSAFSNTFDA